MQNEVCSRLTHLGANESYLAEIKKVFSDFPKPFENMNTEKLCFSKFTNCETFIIPQDFIIGERKEYSSRPTGSTSKYVPVVAQFIPVSRVLTKFFEMPGIFEKTVQYVNSLNSQTKIVSNIIQCPLWKNKLARHEGKTVFPLLMYLMTTRTIIL